jgi:hypothetical protein
MQLGSKQRSLDPKQEPVVRVLRVVRPIMLVPLFADVRSEVEMVNLA